MNCKTTAKAIRENYGSRILSIGYCAAQALLRYETPFAYSSGVYGWNCDYYDIDGVCISTGYRPIGKSVDYTELREAEEYVNAHNEDFGDYAERRQFTGNVLRALIKSALDA